jgi:hypothetical protein
MIEAKDCKNVSDLSNWLLQILINGNHLNFGYIQFPSKMDDDIIDHYINANRFPEIDNLLRPLHGKQLRISDKEAKFNG